jgi:hypothetical protein
MRIPAACLAALLALPAVSAAQAIDRLDVLDPPRLTSCDARPLFRIVVNAVDAGGQPVPLGFSQEDAKKYFRVFEGRNQREIVYIDFAGSAGSAGEAGARSTGSYVILLLDTSGSMNARVPEGGTRFTQAKAAVRQSLTNFNEGVDHLAVVPFDSHNVVSRIRNAAFQTTRQGIEAQIEAIATPDTRANNTALYSAVNEALPILKEKSDAGSFVSLVVFSDGANDVNHPGDDPGLLGPEGLNVVRDAALRNKVPITTVGFGVRGIVAAESALKAIAWPSRDGYYDVESNPGRLKEVFANLLRNLTTRIPILFGPVRSSRDQLAGQPAFFTVRFDKGETKAASRDQGWNPPAVGVPVQETKCTNAETAWLIRHPLPIETDTPTPVRRLGIFGLFAFFLACAWFAAPRFVWPSAYITKPVVPYVPIPPGMASPQSRMPSFSQPSFDPQARNAATPPPMRPQGGRPMGPGGGGDQTVFLPSRPAGGPRTSVSSTPRAPRQPEPSAPQPGEDPTLYRPIDPKRDR